MVMTLSGRARNDQEPQEFMVIFSMVLYIVVYWHNKEAFEVIECVINYYIIKNSQIISNIKTIVDILTSMKNDLLFGLAE